MLALASGSLVLGAASLVSVFQPLASLSVTPTVVHEVPAARVDERTPLPALATDPAASPATVPVVAAVAVAAPAAAPEPEACGFKLGFAELRDAVGAATVGDCLEHEYFAANGDALQRTTNGVLVWRKSSNSAAFSNGHHSWVSGPRGPQRRLNHERLAWELAGDAILSSHRVLAYYGNPLSTAMGILGELPYPQMLERLRGEVEAYAAADPSRPVIGALELVAIVAQEGAGSDGMYRARMEPELIEQVAEWAESNGFLLILDVQPGRSSMVAEARSLLPYLRRPYVHLALDPEFAMKSNQRPGIEIGSIDAQTVNEAVALLSELVQQEKLPPKLLVVHRFTENMLTNYQNVRTNPNVQIVVTMDGFGAPEAKASKYDWLVREQRVQFSGYKLFYRQDLPVMAPGEVLNLDPPPDVVIYQ
jgi:hypothetical protein